MPKKTELGIGGWLGLIISEHNEIFENWTDSELMVDFSIPDNRTEPSPTNKLYDNYFHSNNSGDWPIEAQNVMKNTGLTPKYRFIRQIIDNELNNGYIPLVKLYTYSKKIK